MAEDAAPVYRYKPALMASALELRLKANGLEWRNAGATGLIPYGSIRRVRLSFRPLTMQTYRFLTEIWSTTAPRLQIASSSWKSIVEQERQDGAYNVFVRELHGRIAASGSKPLLQSGSPSIIYWFGLAIFAAAGLSLVALTFRALQVAEWAAAGFIAGFLALFLWHLGSFFYRNQPNRYRPDALPKLVLPRE
jgi:hypothetical protein